MAVITTWAQNVTRPAHAPALVFKAAFLSRHLSSSSGFRSPARPEDRKQRSDAQRSRPLRIPWCGGAPAFPAAHIPLWIEGENGVILDVLYQQTKSLFTPAQLLRARQNTSFQLSGRFLQRVFGALPLLNFSPQRGRTGQASACGISRTNRWPWDGSRGGDSFHHSRQPIVACQSVQTSMAWVVPQARMNTPKQANIQLKGSRALAQKINEK